MRIALEKLGYRETNHGFTIWTSPPEREMWTEAINVKFFGMGKPYGRAEWDQLPGHCVVGLTTIWIKLAYNALCRL